MRQKSIGQIFTVLLICTVLTSCESDEFSMNTYYKSGLCTVKSDQSLYLLTDEGLNLNPVSSEDLSGFTDGDRVLVTYNIVSGSVTNIKSNLQVKIYDIQSIPILDVIDRSEMELNIDDPVWLLSNPWFGGGFLNIEFRFGRSGLDIKHSIYMVYDSFEKKDGKNIINLTFGHNAKSDPTKTTSAAFASFRIGSIKDFQEADSMIVSVYEGLKVVTYHLSL